MNEQKISDIRDILDSVGNKFFHVTFIKRGNGEIRKMLCLTSQATEKGKSGKGQAFNPKEKGLYTVVDINQLKKEKGGKKVHTDEEENALMKKCFRSIPLENVTKITCMGKTLYES